MPFKEGFFTADVLICHCRVNTDLVYNFNYVPVPLRWAKAPILFTLAQWNDTECKGTLINVIHFRCNQKGQLLTTAKQK